MGKDRLRNITKEKKKKNTQISLNHKRYHFSSTTLAKIQKFDNTFC